jgi:hypothetical protein
MFCHQHHTRLYRLTQKLLPLILAGYVSGASADTGKIRLTVIDSITQRPIPNSSISALSRTGETTETRANDQGLVQIDALDPGLYHWSSITQTTKACAYRASGCWTTKPPLLKPNWLESLLVWRNC